MKKRGITHVEIIFSFILFAAAIGFALYFFRPVGTDRLVDSSLAYSFKEIFDKTNTEIDSFAIKINNWSIPLSTDIIGVEIKDIDSDKKGLATTRLGEVLEISRNGDIFYAKGNYSTNWQNIDFITIE